jgi:hypothetical protein
MDRSVPIISYPEVTIRMPPRTPTHPQDGIKRCRGPADRGLHCTGFDILNPVQCFGAGIDAAQLKQNFGMDIVFWSGCVNTQYTMHNTSEAVYRKVREHIDIFNQDGAFVCNAVHNVQDNSPV